MQELRDFALPYGSSGGLSGISGDRRYFAFTQARTLQGKCAVRCGAQEILSDRVGARELLKWNDGIPRIY